MDIIYEDYLENNNIKNNPDFIIADTPQSVPFTDKFKFDDIDQLAQGKNIPYAIVDWYFKAMDWCFCRVKINSIKQMD